MIVTVLLFGGALWVSYANGANDNFKGVATLLGSRTTRYPRALAWGTATTLAGSFSALALAGGLVAAFSGKGLVPDTIVAQPAFLASVGAAAAIVVMAATLLGMPISTTHALVGGLAGAGVAAGGLGAVVWTKLATSFALPLVLSPLCSALLVAGLYPMMRKLRARSGITHETCVCVGTEPTLVPIALARRPGRADQAAIAAAVAAVPTLSIGSDAECVVRYRGRVAGVSAARVLDAFHYLSAGAVGFARGLNDTPKIAALVLAGSLLDPWASMAAVGAGMAGGSILNARRVANTMSHEITPMNPGQGLTANLVTAALVIVASRFSLPVSTTHVSVGALGGLGVATGGIQRKTVERILLAWVVTLPAAFAVAAMVRAVLGSG